MNFMRSSFSVIPYTAVVPLFVQIFVDIGVEWNSVFSIEHLKFDANFYTDAFGAYARRRQKKETTDIMCTYCVHNDAFWCV